MPIDPSQVWFISGCSTGFGREVAKSVLSSGGRAVVTARDKSRVADIIEGAGDRALALDLDVTDASQIAAAVSEAERRFGAIDVLLNNAGYGYQASAEEGDEGEIRALFDANVFGLFALTRAVLPGMRTRRKGHVINITSVGGLMGFHASAYYAASKFAVEGFSDALWLEGQPLGIRVTCIEPGPFRTDWAGRSLHATPTRIAEYAETVGARMKMTSARSGTQAGDPVRAAQAIIDVAAKDKPPRHLVLGAFGIDAVTAKLKERLAEIESQREIAVGTDFPKS